MNSPKLYAGPGIFRGTILVERRSASHKPSLVDEDVGEVQRAEREHLVRVRVRATARARDRDRDRNLG